MSDFKLLLKRRHLLTKGKGEDPSAATPSLASDHFDTVTTGQVPDLTHSLTHSLTQSHCSSGDGSSSSQDIGRVTQCNIDHTPTHSTIHHHHHHAQDSEITTHSHTHTVTALPGMIMGSSLEDNSLLTISDKNDEVPPSHSHIHTHTHAQHMELPNSTSKAEKIDLIFSAGTIRSRYRDVRKEEESRLQKKHNRTMQKHSRALVRESLGLSQQSGDEVNSKSRVSGGESVRPTKKKGVRRTSAPGTEKGVPSSTTVKGIKKKPNMLDSVASSANHHSVTSNEFSSHLTLDIDESSVSHKHAPLRQSENALNSVISVETAADSVEELMLKYYEHEDFKEKLDSENEVEKEDEYETVVLTESVPFTEYPANVCVIDELVYTKFCMDAIYKGDIILIAKKALQQRQHVLLRSPLHYFTHDNIPVSQNPNSKYCITSIDHTSDADRLRECKQILKSIFMSCVAFSSEPVPPDITERTTIEKQISRRKGEQPLSREQEFMSGKSISEFVELEMLIPPKAY